MKIFSALILSLIFVVARAQTAPVAPPPPVPLPPNIPAQVSARPDQTASANNRPPGPPHIPETPWFGSKPLPTDDEMKILLAARNAAEKTVEVMAATKVYAERFGTADDLVRSLMFNNPAINNPDYKGYLNNYKIGQVLHETTWNIGLDNSRDFLLPDPIPNPDPFVAGILSIHMSSGTSGPHRPLAEVLSHYQAAKDSDPAEAASIERQMQDIRASYGLDDIHQAALNDKNAKAALQKVRDAYQALDDAVRATMKQDPAANALLEKYPYLLYGRRDLGFHVVAMMFMT